MNINTILLLASLVFFAVVVALLYIRAKNQSVRARKTDYTTMEKLVEEVKNEMVNTVREDYSLGLSESEFNRLYKRKARVNDALKNCVYGIESAKTIVIDLIRGYIVDNVKPELVSELLGLTDTSEPNSHVKFEILMYKYKKLYGADALAKWVEEYNLNEPRTASDANRDYDKAFYITMDDLDYTYGDKKYQLTNEEKYDILSVLVYQLYKGFGILDTLQEMNINGYNCGTSGSILSAITKKSDSSSNMRSTDRQANRAVWLYLDGKYIHLRFMDFGTEDELRRIIQLLVRWNNPGPLTSKRGYLVNTMQDQSRILALRPPASEYWAVFVRKFTLSDVSPEKLIDKPYTVNANITIRMIEYLMRGQITCAVSGRQGSGKTTLMSSIIRFIDPKFTIRILELAPELYLRELYPSRNILSVQETNTVTAEELQDALKKSDAAASIVGEVASDSIAARMIQMGMTASLFTLFSHHANTAKDLVLTLRNSLVNAGGFSNMETAEKQVTDVVKVDIHLDYTPDGKRYIERISEIIQLEEGEPYPELDPDNLELSKAAVEREYYSRMTDRVSFTTHDLIRYDLDTHTYHTVDRPSAKLEAKILSTVGGKLKKEVELFMLENWGERIDDIGHVQKDVSISTKIEELKQSIEEEEEDAGYKGYDATTGEEDIDIADFISSTAPDADDDFSLGTFFNDDLYS